MNEKEKYNWIKAYYASQNDDCEHEVFVKQEESCSEYFVSDEGTRYHVSELDLTRSDYEPLIFDIGEFEKRNKELEQQYKESQAMYMEMLSKMDANAIADHKAEIEEREYWRKLRGDIALELLRQRNWNIGIESIPNAADIIITKLYNQDRKFFKDMLQ